MSVTVTLRDGDRWASVSREACRETSRWRHVVRKGHPTSACGTTALPASLWRGNTKKPRCPSCVAALTRPLAPKTTVKPRSRVPEASLRRLMRGIERTLAMKSVASPSEMYDVRVRLDDAWGALARAVGDQT